MGQKTLGGGKWRGRYFYLEDVDPNQKEMVCPINEELYTIEANFTLAGNQSPSRVFISNMF